MNTKKRYIVQIPIPSNSGSVSSRRFNDLETADKAANDSHGFIYELDDGKIDLDIDDNNNIIGGIVIKDYTAKAN